MRLRCWLHPKAGLSLRKNITVCQLLVTTLIISIDRSSESNSMQQNLAPESPRPKLLEDTMTPRSDLKDAAENSQPGSEPEPAAAENFQEDDAEAAELARLRCESVRIEEKKQPCKSLSYQVLHFKALGCDNDPV